MRTYQTNGLTPGSRAELLRQIRLDEFIERLSSPTWRQHYYEVIRLSERPRGFTHSECIVCRRPFPLLCPSLTRCQYCAQRERRIYRIAGRHNSSIASNI